MAKLKPVTRKRTKKEGWGGLILLDVFKESVTLAFLMQNCWITSSEKYTLQKKEECIEKLIETILSYTSIKENFIVNLRFNNTKVRVKFKENTIVFSKFADIDQNLSSLSNLLTLIKFLVMDGTCRKLCRKWDVIDWEGELNREEPEEWIFKSCPFPMKIWSGPSKGTHCWILWELFVTWKGGTRVREPSWARKWCRIGEQGISLNGKGWPRLVWRAHPSVCKTIRRKITLRGRTLRIALVHLEISRNRGLILLIESIITHWSNVTKAKAHLALNITKPATAATSASMTTKTTSRAQVTENRIRTIQIRCRNQISLCRAWIWRERWWMNLRFGSCRALTVFGHGSEPELYDTIEKRVENCDLECKTQCTRTYIGFLSYTNQGVNLYPCN